ncbi:MAG TPA: DNA-directed RNA polymerase subunit A' [Candidatus Woesearchaeota archaeon]|nr:DNA-directed RNA polymerase subunit A' [Candidatus Woesearchaeota archaeon]
MVEFNELIGEKVGAIEFKMLSPKIIKKMSVVKIITPELYDADGYPIDSSLMDLKMGVIDPGLRCRTCGAKVRECPGHFGYVEMARPVFHIRHIPTIYTFLRSTCSGCGRILIPQKDIERWADKFETTKKSKGELAMWNLSKLIINKTKNIKKCPHCGVKQERVKFAKPSIFLENNKKLTPIDVKERLERVPDQDAMLLGMDPVAGRPEWAVLTLLPVPPVPVRPSITLESGERSEDDLTHKLGDIVRTNQRLYENLSAGAPEVIIEDLWDLLQYHVTTFFTNNVAQVPPARHRSGRPLKTLAERIKGKEGRFRRNLAGKRVNFSARTVISPDSHLDINEVGVPKSIAKELTVPERVTEWNIDYLKKFIEDGPDNYPSANYVITADGKRKRISDETKKVILEELSPGYIVERHLIDRDIVLFNRQPSLHRMSIMAHRVKVLPHKTFRLNLCTTIPYNADFDGDEMNLHVPQTEEARAEAEILLNVQNNIVTPRYGLPIIGALQDQITGCFLLTKRDDYFTKEEAASLLSRAEVYELPAKPAKKKEGVEYYSGKQIFSKLLPEIDYNERSKVCPKHPHCKRPNCPYATVKIEKGELKTGVIDDRAIGPEAGKGKLIQKIINKYGTEKAMETLQKVAMLGIAALQKFGFTTLLTDIDLPGGAIAEIKSTFAAAEAKIGTLIEDHKQGKIRAYPGRTLRETLEFKIIETINRARNKTGKIVERHIDPENNNIMTMANSGARGSTLNLAIMAASVGQLSLRGKRIHKGYSGRTLPHFVKGDIGPASGGFVRHSYKGGLNPYEFFFNAITGRDTLMDTSMRTPKSGYLQRRLINAMQDVKVSYDGTVRNAAGTIIQFEYGADGLDVAKSDGGKLLIPREEI